MEHLVPLSEFPAIENLLSSSAEVAGTEECDTSSVLAQRAYFAL